MRNLTIKFKDNLAGLWNGDDVLPCRLLALTLISYVLINTAYSFFNYFVPANKVVGGLIAAALILCLKKYATKWSAAMFLSSLLSAIIALVASEDNALAFKDTIYWVLTIVMLLLFSEKRFRKDLSESLEAYSRFLVALVSLCCVLIALGLFIPDCYHVAWGEGSYFAGFASSPHSFASSACLVGSLLLFTFRKEIGIAHLAMLLVLLFAVLQSGARIFIIGISIILICGFYLLKVPKEIKIASIVPVGVLVILLVVQSGMVDKFAYLAETDRIKGAQTFLNIFTSGRTSFWAIDLQAYFESGLLGMLFGGGFDYVYAVNMEKYGLHIWAHNDVISCLLSVGLFGTTLYVGSMARCFASFFDGKTNRVWAWGLILYLLVPTLLNGLYLYQHYMYSFFLFGLCAEAFSSWKDKLTYGGSGVGSSCRLEPMARRGIPDVNRDNMSKEGAADHLGTRGGETLIVCYTYYQLIVAIQLGLKALVSDVSVCLMSHSEGVQSVACNLRGNGLFKRVHLITKKDDVRPVLQSSFGENMRNVLDLCLGRPRKSELGFYDEVVFFNLAPFIWVMIDSICSVRGMPPRLVRMEEGLITCRPESVCVWSNGRLTRVLASLRRMFGRSDMKALCDSFYCFIPELCDEDFSLKPVRIPSPAENREELATALRDVFAYDGFPYPQKYIFFSSSKDIDGEPIGETDVVLRLAEALGPENLLVKMHPRDGRRVYQDAGITVMENSHVPWEVVQLCEDLSDRVLLTCTSGAPLSMTALLEDGTQAVYLRPENPSAEEKVNLDAAMALITPTIARLHELGLCENITEMTVDGFLQAGETTGLCRKPVTS